MLNQISRPTTDYLLSQKRELPVQSAEVTFCLYWARGRTVPPADSSSLLHADLSPLRIFQAVVDHSLESSASALSNAVSTAIWKIRIWEIRIWEIRIWEIRIWKIRIWEIRIWEIRSGEWLAFNRSSRVHSDLKTDLRIL